MKYASIPEAIEAFRSGEFVLVVDDEDRENEGDLIISAELVTPEQIAFMVRHTSGLICVPVEGSRLDELRLPLMVNDNTDTHRTAFTVSVDYTHGTTTGISATDRAQTIRAFTDPATKAEDLARPGHIFPLRYQDGGVLVRPGHTEAAVDLARLAGLFPAGVLCEVVNDDGSMARGNDLEVFSKEHGILMVTIADLIAYRAATEVLIERIVDVDIPTDYGTYRGVGYFDHVARTEQMALVLGEVDGAEDVLVRMHSECLTGDVFGSRRCDCGEQLRAAMQRISDEGRGVIIYNRGHEGRGIGLLHKLQAYRLQDDGRDTVQANIELGFPADARDYRVGAQILRELGVQSVRLLSNNPQKKVDLEQKGVPVSGLEGLVTTPTTENRSYLDAKARKLGHLIDLERTLGD